MPPEQYISIEFFRFPVCCNMIRQAVWFGQESWLLINQYAKRKQNHVVLSIFVQINHLLYICVFVTIMSLIKIEVIIVPGFFGQKKQN